MPNAWQGARIRSVLVGVVVPICAALAGSFLARIRVIGVTALGACVGCTQGSVILFVMYFVEYVLRPV